MDLWTVSRWNNPPYLSVDGLNRNTPNRIPLHEKDCAPDQGGYNPCDSRLRSQRLVGTCHEPQLLQWRIWTP